MPPLRITLDTSAINARGSLAEMNRIERWHAEGRVEIQVPPQVIQETRAHRGEKGRALYAGKAAAYGAGIAGEGEAPPGEVPPGEAGAPASAESAIGAEETPGPEGPPGTVMPPGAGTPPGTVMPPGTGEPLTPETAAALLFPHTKPEAMTASQRRDAEMLSVHHRLGRDVFLTLNTRHFIRGGRRERLAEHFGVQVMTPAEFVARAAEELDLPRPGGEIRPGGETRPGGEGLAG